MTPGAGACPVHGCASAMTEAGRDGGGAWVPRAGGHGPGSQRSGVTRVGAGRGAALFRNVGGFRAGTARACGAPPWFLPNPGPARRGCPYRRRFRPEGAFRPRASRSGWPPRRCDGLEGAFRPPPPRSGRGPLPAELPAGRSAPSTAGRAPERAPRGAASAWKERSVHGRAGPEGPLPRRLLRLEGAFRPPSRRSGAWGGEPRTPVLLAHESLRGALRETGSFHLCHPRARRAGNARSRWTPTTGARPVRPPSGRCSLPVIS
jgi:hypothetical protein